MKNNKTIFAACITLISIVLSFVLSGCNNAAISSSSSYPATDEGAKNLLEEFVKPGADYVALTKKLRPTKADYEAVLEKDLAEKAAAMYEPAWNSGQLAIAPGKPERTQVRVFSTTSDEMKTWTGTAATQFPGGWKQVAPQLKPGLKIYRFDFIEPGKDAGMAYDGLIYVNGNWRIFPKLWRAMN